jgi:hypothetical protein
VDWIERLFHISPDGGNGSLELAIFVALVTVVAAAVSAGTRFARRRRR